jgi:CheY-like chemotaxis protein
VSDSRALVQADQAGALARLADVAEQARDYVAAAKAPNTLRAYRADWRDFAGWCEHHHLPALPAAPETVALYLTALAGQRKAATLQRRLSAISQAHQAAQLEPPTKAAAVRTVWAGIRRTHGTAQTGKAPVVVDELRRMVDALPVSVLGVRDRALLLLGFAGAVRRSELVGLDVADVRQTADGLVVTIRRSKTDQEGQGRDVGIPFGSTPATCPVRAVRAWLTARAIAGPALVCPMDRHGRQLPGRLSDRAVARVVQRAARAAGLDPASYAGHPERVIAQQTGHKSMTVLRRYIRSGSLFRENAAARVGLQRLRVGERRAAGLGESVDVHPAPGPREVAAGEQGLEHVHADWGVVTGEPARAHPRAGPTGPADDLHDGARVAQQGEGAAHIGSVERHGLVPRLARLLPRHAHPPGERARMVGRTHTRRGPAPGNQDGPEPPGRSPISWTNHTPASGRRRGPGHRRRSDEAVAPAGRGRDEARPPPVVPQPRPQAGRPGGCGRGAGRLHPRLKATNLPSGRRSVLDLDPRRRGRAMRAMLVLVVDDDAGARALLAEVLATELGARVVVATDGDSALACIRDERPALVLLDLWMPGMDGPTFYRRVKGDPALARIPVVAVTALPVEEGRAAALAAGCDDCLTKPFDIDDLIAIVQRFVDAGV